MIPKSDKSDERNENALLSSVDGLRVDLSSVETIDRSW